MFTGSAKIRRSSQVGAEAGGARAGASMSRNDVRRISAPLEMIASSFKKVSSSSFKMRRKSELLRDLDHREQPQEEKPFLRDFSALLDGDNFYPQMAGVLGVRILDCELTRHDKETEQIFARLRLRNITKVSQKASFWGSKLIWSEMFCFPLRILHTPKHPFNLFQIDFLEIPDNVSFAEAYDDDQCVIGTVPFHVHDLVKGAPSSGEFTITKGHLPVGNVTVEFFFTYGRFGFGFSPQINASSEFLDEALQFTMFPRCIPESRKDEWSQTLLVPSRRAYTQVLNDAEHERLFPNTHARMKRLTKMKQSFDDFSSRSRIERLMYIRKKINDESLNSGEWTNFFDDIATTTECGSQRLSQQYLRPTLQTAP